MLDPEYLLHISEGAESIAEELHLYIIKRIIERITVRLSEGMEHLISPADTWQIDVLQDAGFLLEDITKEISVITGKMENEVLEAMEEAGIRTWKYDDDIYQAAGISTKSLDESPEFIRIMQRNYEATLGEWENFTRTTADSTQRLFITECDKAYNLVSTGTESYTKAYTDAIKQVVNDGVYVTYTNEDTGYVHKDTIETATLRALRTGIGQMSLEVTTKRMDEMNWDIVLVSAHEGARPGDGGENPGNHAWWQGKYYSRSGNGKFPDFMECTGYGTGEGLGGWNCRHSAGPGTGRDEDNPYRKISTEENRKKYEEQQKARAMERRIRKTKRQVVGYQTAYEGLPDGPEKDAAQKTYDKKCDLLRRQNEAYTEYCRAHNMRPLSERLEIAEWDRKQARESLKAARRFRRNDN